MPVLKATPLTLARQRFIERFGYPPPDSAAREHSVGRLNLLALIEQALESGKVPERLKPDPEQPFRVQG